MKLKINTYGNVSPSFQNLSTEILLNVSEKMGEMPSIYPIHICKSVVEYKTFMNRQDEKFRKEIGGDIGEPLSQAGAQTLRYFDLPETVLVEDVVMPLMRNLEDLEGVIAHEVGHCKEYWTTGKMSFIPTGIPIASLAQYLNSEYGAEANAIEAGYYSGVLSNKDRSIKMLMRHKERADPYDFFLNMNLMSCCTAFMQSDKPPKIQKSYLDTLWRKLIDSRKLKITKELLSSRELKERPEIFAKENLLEDFIVEKIRRWNSY